MSAISQPGRPMAGRTFKIIAAILESPVPYMTIAAYFGCHQQQVQRLAEKLKAAGVSVPKRPRGRKPR